MARMTGGSDRGQLLLVAAIGLGVLLVTLAVILNAAIYTETLATHTGSSPHDETAALQYHDDVQRGVAGIVVYVNDHNATSHETLTANLTAGIEDWNRLEGRHAARDGAAANVSLVATTNGTRIVQEDDTRNFTNTNGTTDWTLAESVTVREFHTNVSEDALYESENETCTTSDGCYYLEVENGSATWRLFVYTTDDAGVVVRITNASGGSGVCTTSDESARIDLTAGTLQGEDCPHLAFAEGVEKPYNVTHVNADRVTGRYKLTVDRELSSSPHYSADGSPSLKPAIYAANVSITYRTADLTYETNLRIAPGESDA